MTTDDEDAEWAYRIAHDNWLEDLSLRAQHDLAHFDNVVKPKWYAVGRIVRSAPPKVWALIKGALRT